MPAALLLSVLLVQPVANLDRRAVASAQTTKRAISRGDIVHGMLAGLVAVGSHYVMASEPESCNWCDRDPSGQDTLNAFDRWVRLRLHARTPDAIQLADTASDRLRDFAVVGLPVIAVVSTSHNGKMRAVQMLGWAHALSTLTTESMKSLAARERPYVHFEIAGVEEGSDRNRSYFSGHASSAFVSLVAAARTCRLLECRQQKLIWLVGGPVAASVGLLRITAEKHYASDVATGAAVGALIGWIVPGLLDRGTNDGTGSLTIRPVTGRGRTGAVAVWEW